MKHFGFVPGKIGATSVLDLPDLGGPPRPVGGVRGSDFGKVRLD